MPEYPQSPIKPDTKPAPERGRPGVTLQTPTPARHPAKGRAGGYLRSSRRDSDAVRYQDFMRALHDPETTYYNPVRRIVTRSHSGIVGEFPSTKVGGMALPYESQLEWFSFALKETDPRVRIYHPQPITLALDLPVAKKRYTADVLVEYWDGRVVLEEVKPERFLNKPEVQERHALAAAAALERGWGFQEVTEAHLKREPRLANAKLLIAYAREPLPEMMVLAAAEFIADVGQSTLAELQVALRPITATPSQLYALALRGIVDPELDTAPLSLNTGVSAPRHVRRYFL